MQKSGFEAAFFIFGIDILFCDFRIR